MVACELIEEVRATGLREYLRNGENLAGFVAIMSKVDGAAGLAFGTDTLKTVQVNWVVEDVGHDLRDGRVLALLDPLFGKVAMDFCFSGKGDEF